MRSLHQNKAHQTTPLGVSTVSRAFIHPFRHNARLVVRFVVLLLVFGGLLALACEPVSLLRPGLTACAGAPGGVDTLHDPAHCGGCGKACNEGQVCSAEGCAWCPETRPKRCTNPAAKDWKDCFDLRVSAGHCGTCDNKCSGNKTCQNGACACTPGQSLCGTACVDLRTDGKNCGTCGAACGPKESCHQGRCIDQDCASISDRLKLCGGGCVNIKKDPSHCGKCDNTCGPRQRCAEGTCECLPGTERCGNICVDLRTHWEHCGKCNTACQPGQACAAGKCESSCPEATPHRCVGGCFHTDFSGEHCGKCGNRCGGGSFCAQGKCVCEPGWLLCNGRCVDAQNDSLHCGKCGERCDGICSSGACGVCLDKKRQCGDDCCDKPDCCTSGGKLRCIDTQTNPLHCGVCDNKCDPGKACIAGVCDGTPPCPTGEARCGPDCADLETDVRHCSRCGNACARGETCNNGVCEVGTPCPTGQVRCSPGCVDVQINAKHCGTCGNACAAGKACQAGVCDGAAAVGWPLVLKSSGTLIMHAMREGSLFVSGTFGKVLSGGGQSHSGKGGREAFVAKWTDTGALSWLTAITSTADITSAHVVPGPGGESVVVGTYTIANNAPNQDIQIGATTLTNAGSSDLYVARLDKAGNVLWALSAGGTKEDGAHDVAFDSKGNIYIAGFIKDKVMFDTTLLNAGVKGKPFIAKIDAGKSTFSWARLIDVDEHSPGQDAIAIRIKGNALIVSSYFAGNATFDGITRKSHHAFIQDLFVAQLDLQSLKFQWASHIGPTSRQGALLAQDGNGAVYVAASYQTDKLFFNGGTKPVIDLGPGMRGRSLMVAKLDSSGTLVWARAGSTIGGSPQGLAYTNALAVTSQGEAFLGIGLTAGALHLTKDLVLFGAGKSTASFVIGLDAGGNWRGWKQSVGSPFVNLRGLLINANSEVVVGGNYNGAGGQLSPTETLPALQGLETGLFLWKFKKP